jgi:hypothetical protein
MHNQMTAIDYTLTAQRREREAKRRVMNFGAAEGPAGQILIHQHLGTLIDYVAEVRKVPPTARKPGRQKSLLSWLFWEMYGASNEKVALAMLSGGLNAALAHEPLRRGSDSGVKGMLAIGWALWRECRGVAISRDKRARKEIIKAVEKLQNIQAREIVERIIARRHGVEFPEWTQEQLVQAGAWGYDCIVHALPNVFPERPGRVLAITESEAEAVAAIVRDLQWQHPVFVPSRVEPEPWTRFRNSDGTPFVHGARDEPTIRQAMRSGSMAVHVEAVNHLQATRWTFDRAVFNFILALFRDREGRKLIKRHRGESAKISGQASASKWKWCHR